MAAQRAVIGTGLFGVPDARLAAAVGRAGGLGVVDLGSDGRAAREALELVRAWTPDAYGVRLSADCALRPEELYAPDGTGPHAVLLAPETPYGIGQFPPGAVLAEVRGLREGRTAVGAGAAGLIARGSECGGPAGELSTFVLLQQLLADHDVTVPVWACGGIGPHTAPAAVLAGAAGVVLDVQLALLDEADTAPELATVLRSVDGTETRYDNGRRTLTPAHPGLPLPRSGENLPLGQDAFLARRFADRYRTAAVAVRAVREAVDRAVRDRGAPAALRPGSPMCGSGSLGTRLPVAQGPMTRVSDQPRFAKAVADAGGLPFLALALADAEQTRALLKETGDTLGERPWGVGILGFAPEEVRTAQLAAVTALRPTHAIVAGGRPAQAAELEAHGIRTFLHVPSPGLLEQFLAAGARRFVFEGAECGGHIGPRNSFPLWEAQLAVLEDFLAGQQQPAVDVLFAGGIHDARSAAAVAALTTGIRAAGATTGILMGTAYLFTEEAVHCGAVQPLYQRQALAAEHTAVLRTGPGQVTRCLPSPYCRTHEARKAELSERGVPEREAWEELEQLNLGRLRLAGKGVERVGDTLVEADEQRQLAEGLFMAGEAAVLRSTTTDVTELHRQVTEEAAEFYERRAAGTAPLTPPGEQPVPEPLGIAVVGMACVFPGAPDLPSYWANVLAGTDSVTEVPPGRWDPAVHHGPQATAHDVTASTRGGFLPRIPFDPLRYGIPPASLPAIDPAQLLALETAARALADAGYDRRAFPRDRTCVIFGAEAGSDSADALTLRTVLPSYTGRLPEELAAQLPALTEDSFPGLLANVIAGRIANRLGLGGTAYTVDAACASSLTALDAACRQLRTGSADLALCGGVDLHNGIKDYLLFSSVPALSPTGRCRPFDADADGITLGEGVACVVLKRLADAERDGDRVYAVVEAVGSSADGRSLGLTAPRREGQRTALERAYAQAGVPPAAAGLVEAHGTGTVVGDRTELAALTEVFTDSGARPGGCVIGSVKSQLGHTKCAAGLAGMIKAALALHTGVRPPTLHLRHPNPGWQPDDSPFVFHDRALPWPAGRRVAGVSAFGFGGTNFHAVLRAADGAVPPRCGHDAWPAELFVLRHTDDARALLRLVEANDGAGRPWRLRDLALTAARRTGTGPVGAAVVAESLDGLPELLRCVVAGEERPGVCLAGVSAPPPGKVALLFPGQGSQWPGMLAELFTAFPETQRHLRSVPSDVLFPPAAFDAATREAQRARLADTRSAQPALGAVCLAVHDVLKRLGVRADMVAGHSYGELVALAAAGALAPETVPDLSTARARAMAAAADGAPGAMAAVAAEPEKTEALLAETGLAEAVVVANHNAPAQTVISGRAAAVEQALAAAADAGLTAHRLPVPCAFHSPLVAGAASEFEAALAGHPFRTPGIPVWSNATAEPYPDDPADGRRRLAAQLAAPVRFVAQIEAMYEAGARVFVEAGPGTVLTGLVRAILGERPHLAVPFAPHPDAGLPGHLHALARLAAAGVPVAAERLFAGRDAVVADARAVPVRPGWTVDGALVRTADGEPVRGGLRPARRIRLTGGTPGAPDAEGPDLLAEFLRGSREMVAAQRDVLLAYFGAGTVPAPVADAPVVPVVASPAPDPEPRIARAPAVDILDTVRTVISERTGYPLELIEPELDLEADLSIDSIKRTEIVGELARRLAGPQGPVPGAWPEWAESGVEELLRSRTARALAEGVRARWGESTEAPGHGTASGEETVPGLPLPAGPPVPEPPGEWPSIGAAAREGRGPLDGPMPPHVTGVPVVGDDTDACPAALPHEPLDPGPGAGVAVVRGDAVSDGPTPPRLDVPRQVADAPTTPPGNRPLALPPERHLLRETPLAGAPAPDDVAFSGWRFLLLGGDSPLARALLDRLNALGATATRATTPPGTHHDGVIHVDALTAGTAPLLPAAFSLFQDVLRTPPRYLLCARPEAEEARTAGLDGLFRSLAREYPDSLVRSVALGGERPAAVLADELVGELLAPDRAPVVRRAADGTRYGTELYRAPLPATGGAPAFVPGSVVLLAGGARGITARTAVSLAAAGCRVELLGRTGIPTGIPTEAEDPALAAASGLTALRSVLAARGGLPPAGIEREARRILARREVVATLAAIEAVGGTAHYHRVDLRDHEAVRATVGAIHADAARIDAVVHAAGVVEDRLFADKEPDSLARVHGTKVDGAHALLSALRDLPEPPHTTVLFGSVAAVLGNRGQTDYSAANDALAVLGRQWRQDTGSRTLTVHWGPWAPDPRHPGMVGPELARAYARRGLALIDPEEGVRALLRELAHGDPEITEVVLTAPGRLL
ncbi:SDR family NAD(P)-dependent oxidoreductase [Streptomyces gamaensis]|uniref:SDR family NAD(P)-dependent oxidoreductase n=1 Tax=Streptomyces gamaensis TaxID=1763542 RepID=A0ABW0ZDV2_9ACTN